MNTFALGIPNYKVSLSATGAVFREPDLLTVSVATGFPSYIHIYETKCAPPTEVDKGFV